MLDNANRLAAMALAIVALGPIPELLEAQESYDVVIRSGRVMDPETGLDAVRNVGINGQTIVVDGGTTIS